MLEINETRQVLKSLNLETVNHLWGQKLVYLFFQLGNDRTFSPVQIFKTLPKVLVRQNKNKINPTKKGKYQIQNNRNNIVLFEKKKKFQKDRCATDRFYLPNLDQEVEGAF